MPEKDCLFVSDVHLNQNDTAKTKLLCWVLTEHAINTDVFLLGDIFDAWLGDDTIGDWLEPLAQCIKELQRTGSKFYLMTGNHDFLVGNRMYHKLQVNRIADPYILTNGSLRILLTHGDKLCSNDIMYQKIRPILQNRVTKFIFNNCPLSFRKKLAKSLKGNGQPKIISENTLTTLANQHNCQAVVHGHIHKKYIKQLPQCTLISLSPWDTKIVITKLIKSSFKEIEIKI